MRSRFRFRFRSPALVVALSMIATACSGSEGATPIPTTIAGPMNGVEVVVGGTPDPTDRIMSAMMVLALEQRGALVIDRSNTPDAALNRDDLVAGRLQIVPEDIGTGWFIHLGQSTTFRRTTELATELRAQDRSNGIEWSDHSSFDDALVGDRSIATDAHGLIFELPCDGRKFGVELGEIDGEAFHADDSVGEHVDDDFAFGAGEFGAFFRSRNRDVELGLGTTELPRHDEENQQQEHDVDHRSQLHAGWLRLAAGLARNGYYWDYFACFHLRLLQFTYFPVSVYFTLNTVEIVVHRLPSEFLLLQGSFEAVCLNSRMHSTRTHPTRK